MAARKVKGKNKEYITRLILAEDGKIIEERVKREEVIKEIRELLKRDKDFLEIMEKL